MKKIIFVICIVLLLLCECTDNNIKKENVWDISEPEYRNFVQDMVFERVSGDSELVSCYCETYYPYLLFTIQCKYNVEEFNEKSKQFVEDIFTILKKYEYEAPFWRYSFNYINFTFESIDRDKYTKVLEKCALYSIDVEKIKDASNVDEILP